MRAQYFEPEILPIPRGYFWMGSHERDTSAWDTEKPYHGMYLDDYWIGRFPITNREFQCFTTANPDYQMSEDVDSQNDNQCYPVVWVTWHDANEYCNWLSKVSGRSYKLPSEPQWEKAARGIDGRLFPWGNHFDKTRLNSAKNDICHTTPVGTFSPLGVSPYGCSDMCGNVWE
jgi:formylglycine-generating enzyme required for sulfatase activity